MKVLQVLPCLNSGGVERGTLDFARSLVAGGHQSLVMSSGGRLQAQLEQEGSRHVRFAVHAKSPLSLLRVPALRRLLLALAPDVIHVRSRVPAWMVWLALKPLPARQRPLLVSTFHGLYSVSLYSAIMGCGDRVIAISECVRDYILRHYPQVDPARIQVIPRGADTSQFCGPGSPDWDASAHQQWRTRFDRELPATVGRPLLLMPGRLSPWKGQHEFIDLIADLQRAGIDCSGLIVGEPTPGKERYLHELRERAAAEGLAERLYFPGHRDDMDHLYIRSNLVFNLSRKAEPFGRTVIEALAVGTPVVSWDEGGPAESLREAFPQGLVAQGDRTALAQRVGELLAAPPPAPQLPPQFTLQAQAEATLAVYREGLAAREQG
ncbi:MAG: glycosyltransferase family 4 protein [Parahaliea sp.]